MHEIYRALNDALIVQKSEKVHLTLLDMKFEKSIIRIVSETKLGISFCSQIVVILVFIFSHDFLIPFKNPDVKCGPMNIELLFTSPLCAEKSGKIFRLFFCFTLPRGDHMTKPIYDYLQQ